MNCKICNTITQPVFQEQILGKFSIQYWQCPNCLFGQTDEPFWLQESYSSAINDTDIGLIHRNVLFSEMLACQLSMCGFNANNKYLDYGGGYGMYVRMMRDYGYNFWWWDKYCDNIYATRFAAPDPDKEKEGKNNYEAITAFEVMEHLEHPMAEVEKLLQHTDTFIFSTQLIPNEGFNKNWWYVMPEHGQHIAFYHRKTLDYIARKRGLKVYSNGTTLHMLTKRNLSKLKFRLSHALPFARLYNTFFKKKSLLEQDHELYIKQSKNNGY